MSEVKILNDYEIDLQFYPPEKLTKKVLKPNSDVYSLGVIFYYILTGKLPFEYSDLINL